MDLEKWKKEAILVQDLHSTALNDRKYDRFQFDEAVELRQKVLGILFGPVPEDENKRNISSWASWQSLYKEDQIKKCNEIIGLIKENTLGKTSYDFAYIVICVLYEKTSIVVPVFRVRSNSRQESRDMAFNVFIDHFGRVYKNWDAYLKENTWDMSWLCVPVDGYYSTQYNYRFIDQSNKGKVVNVLNKVSTVTGFASALTALGGAAMTLFPPTAPLGLTVLTSSMVAGIPSGIYGLGSGVHKLHDRSSHKQSISLSDAESRMCWLNISAGALSFASAGFTKGLSIAAGAGKAIPQSVRIVGNTLTISSLGLSGTGVAVSIYDVSKKGWSNVTAFDVLQISTSLLIFTHSAVTTKLANSIINEAQTNQLNAMKSPLGKKDQIKIDRKIASLVDEHGPIAGKQQMILELKKIDNVPAFLSKWRTVNGDIKPAGSKYSPSTAPGVSSTAPFVSKQRLQLATSNNVVIGNTPVTRLTSMDTVRLNSILFKLSEYATKVFLQLISKIQVKSLAHMHTLIEKFMKYVEEKVAEWRKKDPNPAIASDSNVLCHYKTQELNSLSKTSNATIEKILSEDFVSIDDFIPELNVLPVETYSEYVDIIVDDEDNEKEWKQYDNFLSCTCTLTRTGETRIIEFSHDKSERFTFATDKLTGETKRFVREDLFHECNPFEKHSLFKNVQ